MNPSDLVGVTKRGDRFHQIWHGIRGDAYSACSRRPVRVVSRVEAVGRGKSPCTRCWTSEGAEAI